MKRRIFPWMGLVILFLFFGLGRETSAQEIYKVKHGDTIAKIAKNFGVSPEALKKANHLRGTAIKQHQVLTIPTSAKRKIAKGKKTPSPPPAYYTVKKGDSLSSIAQKTGLSVSTIRERNNLRSIALKTGQKLLMATSGKNQEKIVKPAISASTGPADFEEEDGDLTDDALNSSSLAEMEINAPSDENLLGTWHDPEERKLFVKVSQAFLGAPYRWGGISLRGLDCSAFVKKIYQLFGISLPRTAREQAHMGMGVARNDLVEGDLVFFNTKRLFGHVGIYIGNNEFVHASSRNRGVRIDKLDEPYFNKRFVKAVRLKGLDERVL